MTTTDSEIDVEFSNGCSNPGGSNSGDDDDGGGGGGFAWILEMPAMVLSCSAVSINASYVTFHSALSSDAGVGCDAAVAAAEAMGMLVVALHATVVCFIMASSCIYPASCIPSVLPKVCGCK